jgi:hypothetical protein
MESGAWPRLVKWLSRGAMTLAAWMKKAKKDQNRLGMVQKWSEYVRGYFFDVARCRPLQGRNSRQAEPRPGKGTGAGAQERPTKLGWWPVVHGFGGAGARAPPRRISCYFKIFFHISVMSPSDAKLALDPTARTRAEAVPAWVTDDLIRKTLAVWQPYYKFTLTTDDAVGIILRVGMLMNVLSRR